MVYLSRRPGGEEVNALVCKTDMRGCESPPGLKSYIVVESPGWRNGLRRRLKIFDLNRFVGSTPTPGTTPNEQRSIWCGAPAHLYMFYVYVLNSLKDSKGYIGSTTDLRRRLSEHNSGKVASTKPRLPFELIYYEAYKNEKDARLREASLKLKSKAYAQLRKRLFNSLPPVPYVP